VNQLIAMKTEQVLQKNANTLMKQSDAVSDSEPLYSKMGQIFDACIWRDIMHWKELDYSIVTDLWQYILFWLNYRNAGIDELSLHYNQESILCLVNKWEYMENPQSNAFVFFRTRFFYRKLFK
jgi:hypothetical protein